MAVWASILQSTADTRNLYRFTKEIHQKKAKSMAFDIYILELQEEPDGGSNAESGSSNPVTKSEPRQWKKGK